MKKIALTAFAIITLMGMCILTSCSLLTTQPAANSAKTETSFEPTETAAVPTPTPTPTPATLETVVTLPVPATYASLYDGLKLYSDGSRTIILKTLIKGDQVTITGTAGQYGVTADGAYINLHLMIVVITVTATPTPAETSAAPTDPTSATTAKPTTTTKPTTAATTAKPTTVATTAATTTAPVTSLSASEVESIVWSAVIDARNVNGFTTNKSDLLSAASRNHASSYTIRHPGHNGDLESCGNIGIRANGTWGVMLTAGQTEFASLSDAAFAMGRELITDHVAAMASTAAYTEFGVGVAKEVFMGTPTYYVYISCSSPEDLQWQIDQGWYN